MPKNEQFLTGCEAAVLGALAADAEIMFGYPITPSTEILQGWIEKSEKNKRLKYLQTEDETSAGFGLIGAILGGAKAFTTTAGVGTVLMQDPMSMAENLRIPFVAIVMQRGGPSTGTVNFSQQEVNLTAFGGNGDGLRVVYSASNVAEMFYLVAKAFSTAWKYRFPTVVLGDGYLAKMKSKVTLARPIKPVISKPLLKEQLNPTYLRNCYSDEESFGKRLQSNIKDWFKFYKQIAESETYRTAGAKEIIIAHGTVADAAKDAIDVLRKKGKKIGLFRPITLNPFDKTKLEAVLSGKKKVYIFESSLNQFCRIVKYNAYGLTIPIVEITKPAVSFSSEEITRLVLN